MGLLNEPDFSSLDSASGAAFALLESEKTYVQKGLRVLFQTFDDRLTKSIEINKPILEKEDTQMIFQNLFSIFTFHEKLYKDLLQLRLQSEDALLNGVGGIMNKCIPFFKLYQNYNSKKAVKHCKALKTKNKPFAKFLQLNELVAAVDINSLLELPTSRLPQYLVYLMEIKKRMSKEQAEANKDLQSAIQSIVKIMNDIANHHRDIASRGGVLNIQEKVLKGTVHLVTPTRALIKHGDIVCFDEKNNAKKSFMACFNDALLICTKEKGGLIKKAAQVTHLMQLGDLKAVISMPDDKRGSNLFAVSHVLDAVLCSASTEEEKMNWISCIKKQIDALKAGIAQLKISNEEFEKTIMKGKSLRRSSVVKYPTPAPSNGTGKKGGFFSKKETSKIQQPEPSSSVASPTASLASSSSSSSSPHLAMGGGYGGGSAAAETTALPVVGLSPEENPNYPWEALLADEGEVYYENVLTQETQWEKPDGWIELASDMAATAIEPSGLVIGDWERLIDEQSGDYYYENLVTQTTTWDPPDCFLEHEAALLQHPIAGPSPPIAPPSVALAPSLPTSLVAPPMAPTTHMPPLPPSAPAAPQPPMAPAAPAAPTAPSAPSVPRANPAGPPAVSKPKPVAVAAPSLLDQIAAGKQLKKAPAARAAAAGGMTSGGGGGDVMEKALTETLARYRQFVQAEDDENENDDDDWA